MNEALKAKYANDPIFLAILKDGLEIQDRFSAEPIYARTGKGYLKSAGVEEIRKAKIEEKERSSSRAE